MTITPLWRAGAESQSVLELPNQDSFFTSPPAISSTKAHSGTYSFAFTNTDGGSRGIDVSTTQFTLSYYVNHNGLHTGGTANRGIHLFYTDVTGVSNCAARWVKIDNTIRIVVNGSTVATVDATTAGFDTTNTWIHVGIHAKSDASTGFVSIYINGVQVATYTGNTGTGFNKIFFAGRQGTSGGWDSTAYVDDIVINDTTGEADGVVPERQLRYKRVDGAGINTNWIPSAENNYQNVDDPGAPDNDTTYNSAASSGLKDSYALADLSGDIPAGSGILDVAYLAYVRKSAGVASTVKIGGLLSASEDMSSEYSPATSYGMIEYVSTAKPGGGLWQQSDFNNTEIQVESAGIYSSSDVRVTALGAYLMIAPGNTYSYRVRATNASGDSEYSNEVSVVV